MAKSESLPDEIERLAAAITDCEKRSVDAAREFVANTESAIPELACRAADNALHFARISFANYARTHAAEIVAALRREERLEEILQEFLDAHEDGDSLWLKKVIEDTREALKAKESK